MAIRDICQSDVASDPKSGLQALLRAILIRTQFDPIARHVIGWRGLKSVAGRVEGWTAKIRDSHGVFGIGLTEWEKKVGWLTGRFDLAYFPAPQEPLVERCSLAAAADCQAPDYMEKVREFLLYSEFMGLFGIGRILLAVSQSRQSLYLGLESLSTLRVTCVDGIRLPQEGHMVQVVAPGGYDQFFPAFEVASCFFDVLAASITFNIGEPPDRLCERRFDGWEVILEKEGNYRRIPTEDPWRGHIGLTYGSEPFENVEDYLNCGGLSKAKTIAQWQAPQPIPAVYSARPWWNAHPTKPQRSLEDNSSQMDARPPLIVLSGFLGAGKTSFLKHFIEYQTQRSRFVAVIQNEIGAVGLDGKLLDYTVTEIDAGCVCCSLVGSLKQAVRRILFACRPDAIIVETTGTANPLNLLDEIGEIDAWARFDCTVTVVDAMNISSTLSDYAFAADQIRAADVLILNKKDLITPAELSAVMDLLRGINPHAPLFPTVDGDINPARIFDTVDRHSHHDMNRASHRPGAFPHASHLQDGLWSHTLRLDRPLVRADFLRIVSGFFPGIFRAKGIVEFSDDPQPMLFQYVAGRYELCPFTQPHVQDRFLTLIGKEDDPTWAIAAISSLMTGPDTLQ